MDRQERIECLKPLLRQVLEILGEDPNREGLRRTPERWAEALLTYTQGSEEAPEDHLSVIFQLDEDDFPQGSDDMIIQDNIQFTSTCEHHIAPIRGVVHMAYIPNGRSRVITGLSKLSRVVELFARRLQVQERMTQQIARAIDTSLDPLGVIVVVEAVHYCMISRGVQQRSSTTITTARRGAFQSNPALENKFQEYLRLRRSEPIT
ncbi:MAG: GTP cyclohydrolase I FolE [Chloroflexota bacterium]|nr:GTP cyclohydrolase I FolE [Chloroflexota bacterium]